MTDIEPVDRCWYSGCPHRQWWPQDMGLKGPDGKPPLVIRYVYCREHVAELVTHGGYFVERIELTLQEYERLNEILCTDEPPPQALIDLFDRYGSRDH